MPELGGTQGGHSMTIVGYDDNIKFDYNNDGLYTTNLDINNDGIVNLEDREYGAVKIANSWGNWANAGYIWLPYKFLCGGSNAINSAKVCHAIEYKPDLTIKTTIEHPKRRKVGLSVGYATNANQSSPIESNNYKTFDYQGGWHDMRGAYDGPIELGFDFGYWYGEEDFGKIFLLLDEDDTSYPLSDGIIESFSIIDYRWDEEFELICNESNVSIIHNDLTTLSIEYDLIPHEAAIQNNLFLFSNMVSRFTSSINNSSTLTLEEGIKIDMYESEIHIQSGSSFVIEDNAIIKAKKGNCKIIIDGNIQIGDNVSFIAEDGAKLDIILNNNSQQVTFDNSIFRNVNLDNFSQSLTVSYSEFNDYYRVLSHRGNVVISNTDFFSGPIQSWLLLENTEDNENSAQVLSCNFSTSFSIVGIDMWNYKNYRIYDNTITGFNNGIQILQSGYGNGKKSLISENSISNSTNKGILSYGSRGGIYNNKILNNVYGIWLGNHSEMSIYGNSSASTNLQTQLIQNNSSYEIYASTYSFPSYFSYNVIIDDDNSGAPNDPLIYFSGGATIKDVRNNCWENISGSFNATTDLYPSGFIWQPTWCPSSGKNEISDAAKDMYETGTSLFENENYEQSQDIFEILIEQYPESDYANAALQELYALEKFTSNDYTNLKNYYTNNTTIQSTEKLTKSGDYFAAKCDTKLNNWSFAIEYYEDIILNPESMEDSIFAIIDLGYVYYNMQNSQNKSSYSGNLTQYKPATKERFVEHRDYLLSLIPKNSELNNEEQHSPSIMAELIQNTPNPFAGKTQISYKLLTDSEVKICVYNYTGQLIETVYQGHNLKENHVLNFDARTLGNGIYLYTISINGQITDSKKMTVLK